MQRTALKGVAIAGAVTLLLGALLLAVVSTISRGIRGPSPGAIPAAYAALILRSGSACDALSPARLAAQLYQESKFNASATSHKGAIGIAQFMPQTWAEHGLDANGDGKADPRDPEDAIPA